MPQPVPLTLIPLNLLVFLCFLSRRMALPPTQSPKSESWASSQSPPSHTPRLIHHQVLLFLLSKYLWNASTSLSTAFTQATLGSGLGSYMQQPPDSFSVSILFPCNPFSIPK